MKQEDKGMLSEEFSPSYCHALAKLQSTLEMTLEVDWCNVGLG